MIHIPYGKTLIDFDETGANVLTSRIDELKAEKEPAAEDEAVEAEVEEVSEPAEKTEEVVFEVVEDAPEIPTEPETPAEPETAEGE